MTIKIDHLNLDRSEDPGYWYLWSLDFNTTFRFLYNQLHNVLGNKSYNINIEPPPPSNTVMWVIYVHTLELYLKTFLLVQKMENVKDLSNPNKFSHDLEALRKRCAEKNNGFNNKDLIFITQDLRKFTNLRWEFIKYPPKKPPLEKKSKIRIYQHTLPIYGKSVMLNPLEILDNIVKPLIYVKD